MNEANAHAAAGYASPAPAHPIARSPLKRAKVDANGKAQGHRHQHAHLSLPAPSLGQLPPPVHPQSLAPPHSSTPFQSQSGFASSASASAASAHTPLGLLGRKRIRLEAEGEVEALLVQLSTSGLDNEQQQQQRQMQLQAAAAAQQWAGASAAAHAVAAASSPAHASSSSGHSANNYSMYTDPTPSPLNSGAVIEARFPSPLPAQLAELDEYEDGLDENGPRDTSRDVATPARTVSMERMQSFARFQPSTAALMGVAARPIATVPQLAAAAASAASAAAALSGGWSPPQLQLVDPLVLAQLSQHLPVLPSGSLMPGLGSEVLVLMLLSKWDIDSLPQGGAPLTQAQFLEGLRRIGCDSDQQLQLMLQNMLVEFLQPPAPKGNSATSSSTSSSPHAAASISPAFKSFFLQCFSILRRICGPAAKKALDLPTARRFLGLLLGERFPQHMYPFLSFLDELVRRAEGGNGTQSGQSGGGGGAGPATPNVTVFSAQLETHRYSYDKWACTLEWCLSIHPHTLAGYDEEGSWPVVFDEFVVWLCERAPAVREASAREAAAAAAAAAAMQQRTLEERPRAGLDDASSTNRAASDVFISSVLAEQSAAASASSAAVSSSSGSQRGGSAFGCTDAVQSLDADLDDAADLLASSLDSYEPQSNVTGNAGFHSLAHPSMPLSQRNSAADLTLNPYERTHRQLQQQQQPPLPAIWPSSTSTSAMQSESHNMCDQD